MAIYGNIENVDAVLLATVTAEVIHVKGADGKDGAPGAPGTPGKDGHSPVVTATKSGKTTTISVDGAAIATVEDGADGKPGAAGQTGASGADGITPHIGDNGNWYLGSTDTGKPSRGATGPQGAPGIYYGTTQPTGDTHPVWIDPGGDQDDGGLLPAVTTNDNGKFLRVVNGAWAATATQMATTSEVNAVSTRVSTLESAGYLTLETLPKYGGESE